MKKGIIIWILVCILIPLRSQNLIGLPKEVIYSELLKEYPTFVRDNTFVNHSYNYLKYIDKVDEQTLLIFLSDQNICTSTKLICDYSELNSIKLKLKKYKQISKDKWMYSKNGKTYFIRLKREEWFFSLFTSLKS